MWQEILKAISRVFVCGSDPRFDDDSTAALAMSESVNKGDSQAATCDNHVQSKKPSWTSVVQNQNKPILSKHNFNFSVIDGTRWKSQTTCPTPLWEDIYNNEQDMVSRRQDN